MRKWVSSAKPITQEGSLNQAELQIPQMNHQLQDTPHTTYILCIRCTRTTFSYHFGTINWHPRLKLLLNWTAFPTSSKLTKLQAAARFVPFAIRPSNSSAVVYEFSKILLESITRWERSGIPSSLSKHTANPRKLRKHRSVVSLFVHYEYFSS